MGGGGGWVVLLHIFSIVVFSELGQVLIIFNIEYQVLWFFRVGSGLLQGVVQASVMYWFNSHHI